MARHRNGFALCDSQITAASSFKMGATKPFDSTTLAILKNILATEFKLRYIIPCALAHP
jgi:hypothetical protein